MQRARGFEVAHFGCQAGVVRLVRSDLRLDGRDLIFESGVFLDQAFFLRAGASVELVRCGPRGAELVFEPLVRARDFRGVGRVRDRHAREGDREDRGEDDKKLRDNVQRAPPAERVARLGQPRRSPAGAGGTTNGTARAGPTGRTTWAGHYAPSTRCVQYGSGKCVCGGRVWGILSGSTRFGGEVGEHP